MKKVKDWQLWDWKSIMYGILIFIVFSSFFYFMNTYPDFMRAHRAEKFTKITHADFIKWHRISNTSQSRTGQSTTTVGFEITYCYFVNEQKTIGKDMVPYTDKNQKFLGKLQYEGITEFVVKYDPEYPSHSQIIIDSTIVK